MSSASLGERLAACGPVIDAEAAGRAHERLSASVAEGGLGATLDAVWPALAPVFAASPYLFGLARRWPDMLDAILADAPDARLEDIAARTIALTGGADDMRSPLRKLKAELHLLTALADLGGVWDLDQVTGALSRFADVASRAALSGVAEDLRRRSKLLTAADDTRGPIPGLF
eukprot:gene40254-54436_t